MVTKLLINLQRRLRGSLVEQVVPAVYDVDELSTTETDPESEPSVADAPDPSPVETACGASVARERRAQWTTRKPTRDVGDGEERCREVVSGQEERVNCTTILRAFLVVVLESCERVSTVCA